MELLILNGTILNNGQTLQGSILISDGKIKQIFTSFTPLPRVSNIIDATDKYVLPGAIDTHVHFRQPGLTHKASIRSESRAALAGGVTTFFDMPNTFPPTTSATQLKQKLNIAVKNSAINYGFYIAATHDNLQKIKQIPTNLYPGIKIFYAPSTGNLLCNDHQVIGQYFDQVHKPFVIHSEDLSLLLEAQEKCKTLSVEEYPDKHIYCRPAQACYSATKTLLELASHSQARVHFLHISTKQEIELLQTNDNPRITAEVCPHYLWFSREDYATMGNLIKVNPAIKTDKDREALINAIKQNIINTIGTDHAPHLIAEKQRPYAQAPSGAPSVQHFYPAIFQIFENNNVPFTLIPQLTAHNPARIFGIKNRGFIEPGQWADIAIIEKKSIKQDRILHKCGWSVFQDQTINYRVLATIVNGQVGWYDGELHATKPQAIKFL